MKDLEKRLAWLKEFKEWSESGGLDEMIAETEEQIEALKRSMDGQV